MHGLSRTGNCSAEVLEDFSQRTAGLKQQLLRVNGLTVANAILGGILVGIGTCGPRHYHHRPVIRSLHQGATALFLPILSYAISHSFAAHADMGRFRIYSIWSPAGTEIQYRAICFTVWHMSLAVIWAVLVQIIAINTCASDGAADEREGHRNSIFPVLLLVKAIWTTYLAVPVILHIGKRDHIIQYLLPFMIALIYSKIALRYQASREARSSVALGRNPRLVAGYMKHLQDGIISQHGDQFPPPLILMGEDTLGVERQPHGIVFKSMGNQGNNGLVTIDKVWQSDDTLLASEPWLKELCLGFSLFKLLRCRIAGYTTAEAGFPVAYNFCLHVILKDMDNDRALAVVTEELSFLHAYYYSSTAAPYSNRWIPISNIIISLLTIGCCLLLALMVIARLHEFVFLRQIICLIWCSPHPFDPENADGSTKAIGNLLFEMVPVLILLVLVVLAEAWHIASYVCSDWTKVSLICNYVVNSHGTLRRSPRMRKWIGLLLRCRCTLMKHWDYRMDQCSVLVVNSGTDPVSLGMRRLLHLPDTKHKVKVPRAVNKAIVDAITVSSNNGIITHPSVCLHLLSIGAAVDEGKCISGLILMSHIATSILEVKHQQQQQQHQALSDHVVISAHMSRYCAYLVAYVPELLPDDDEWCKSLYKAVKKDSMHALAGRSRLAAEADDYEKLVSLLKERAENEVLRDGLKLGMELAELPEGEEAAWVLMARFWIWMIMYVASSDILIGHKEAIARGGELITLVWALLLHAGIVGR